METRFSKKNIDLLTAITFLIPKSSAFLESTLLRNLHVLGDTAADCVTLRNEILVAKPMLVKKFSNETDLSTV